MAEQPLRGDEVVDPKFLDQAIQKANEFLEINKELTSVLKANLEVSKQSLSAPLKISNSKELKAAVAVQNEAIKQLKDLEVLEQQKLRTEQALIKVQLEKDRALKQQIATEQAFENAVKKEAKAQEESLKVSIKKTNVLQDAKKQLTELSNRLELNTFKIKQNAIADTESGRSRVRTAALVAQAQKELYATITEVEQGSGRFNRNVGNYKSAFDGLGNSVNQLTRELPAFAVSAQTGFLAISNNLPIFFDQLQKINAENKILIEQGKKTQSVLSQLGGAVFSLGSLLSIGVTLLTLYGKEIIEMVTALFEGEKALESITKANEDYNKSINKTKEDITAVTIQLKVQAGILTKNEGDLLKNENERTKALNTNKELRKKSIDALREEVGLNKDLQYENVKLGLLSKSAYDAKALEAQTKYQKGLEEINEKQSLSNDYVNEYYNLQGKLVKEENGSGKLRQKSAKEELIIKKNLYEQIRQQEINNIKDEEERELQQAAFNTEKAQAALVEEQDLAKEKIRILEDNYKKEAALEKVNTKDADQQKENLAKLKDDYERERKQLEASVATKEEYDQLKILLEEEYQIKITEITDKYSERAEHKQVENNAKTKAAQEEVRKDLANFEISELERVYKEKEKKLEGFNLREINNLERQISAKKVVEIQAEADRKKLLTDNAAEQLAIQTEADIAIEKESQRSEDVIKANRQKAFAQAMQFEQQLLDAIGKAEAEKSKLRQDAFSKQISDQEKNIDTQRKLAERGLNNTLAEEEARKAQLERKKEEEKEKELKRQKAIAFFKSFSNYLEKGDEAIVALGKAATATVLADAVAGAFFTGTEKVEDDLKGNKVHNGKDGYRIAVDGSERILTGDQNKMVGDISNEALAKLAYDYNNGFLDTVKYTAIPSSDFAKNVYESAQLNEIIALRKEVQGVKEAIDNKPVSNYTFTGYEFIKETIENNHKTTVRQQLKRPKL